MSREESSNALKGSAVTARRGLFSARFLGAAIVAVKRAICPATASAASVGSSSALVLCAVLLTSVAVLSSGCFGRGNKVQKGAGNSTTIGGKASPKDEKRAAEAAAAEAQKLVPGPVLVIGRVIAIDQRTLTTLIAVSPYSVLPTNFKGSILISRTDDLRPTARLEATPYLRGRTLGARLLNGRPQIGDEVVLAPAAQ